MKILQVITSLHTGGAEKLIVDMVPLYIAQGHQVDVLLFDGTDTPFKRQLQEKGVVVYELGKGRSVYNPINLFKLVPFLRKYDIVHTHNTACQLFAAIGSVLCSVVLVTTEHNTSNRRRDWKWYRLIDKWMYSRYRAVISISIATTKELKKYLHRIKCPVYTILNGINLKMISSATTLKKEDFNCRNDSFLIMMVAGFREQKDQDTVIRSLSLLPNKVQLCLVGDGVRRQICEDLVRSLNLEKRVIFTGVRPDVPCLMKSADVIILSSHYEGFGLVAVEGMAARKPVVATNIPGLAEVVENAGILFPHGNEKVLAEIIKKLMTNKEYYQEVADKCVQRAAEYDIQKTVQAYMQVYKRIYQSK